MFSHFEIVNPVVELLLDLGTDRIQHPDCGLKILANLFLWCTRPELLVSFAVLLHRLLLLFPNNIAST